MAIQIQMSQNLGFGEVPSVRDPVPMPVGAQLPVADVLLDVDVLVYNQRTKCESRRIRSAVSTQYRLEDPGIRPADAMQVPWNRWQI